VLYELGGEEMISGARKAEIIADAAHAILTLRARPWTSRFFLDDEVLLGAGVHDFGKYDASRARH
jgi:citronellol/citronellal dehydrogenase